MVETKGCNDDLWFLSGDIPSVQNLEGACLLFQPVMSNSSLYRVGVKLFRFRLLLPFGVGLILLRKIRCSFAFRDAGSLELFCN